MKTLRCVGEKALMIMTIQKDDTALEAWEQPHRKL